MNNAHMICDARATTDKKFSNRPDYADMSEIEKHGYRILVGDTLAELLADVKKHNRATYPETRANIKIVAMEIAEMGYCYDVKNKCLLRSDLWVAANSPTNPPVVSFIKK